MRAWDALTFVLNGLVFVLIGLQLPVVVGGIADAGLGRMVAAGAAFSALVIALRADLGLSRRPVVVLHTPPHPGGRTSRAHHASNSSSPGGRECAASSLWPPRCRWRLPCPPRSPAAEGRDRVITFCVIVATLVVQGLTLPALIRLLGLAREPGPDCEEQRRGASCSSRRYRSSSRCAPPTAPSSLPPL